MGLVCFWRRDFAERMDREGLVDGLMVKVNLETCSRGSSSRRTRHVHVHVHADSRKCFCFVIYMMECDKIR